MPKCSSCDSQRETIASTRLNKPRLQARRKEKRGGGRGASRQEKHGSETSRGQERRRGRIPNEGMKTVTRKRRRGKGQVR